jgi:hypothetical protein
VSAPALSLSLGVLIFLLGLELSDQPFGNVATPMGTSIHLVDSAGKMVPWSAFGS